MRYIISIFLSLLLVLLCSCNTAYQTITYNEPPKGADSLEIHEGILSQTAQRIKYKKDGKVIAIVELSEPVMISIAEQEEEWGYFQFPYIAKTDDGTLVVSWQMMPDSHESYGMSSERNNRPFMSKDGGKTWRRQDKEYGATPRVYSVQFNQGGLLQINTPKSRDINSYSTFPSTVGTKGAYEFYYHNSLPEELQGVYLSYIDKNKSINNIHAKLNDPGLLRYSIDGLMPIVWWGNMKELNDHTLIAGVYPCYYLNDTGAVQTSGVSFYKSKDEGRTWNLLGKIPMVLDKKTGSVLEFSEPTIEVLNDGTIICIMRSGSFAPMFKSLSMDMGNNWSTPKAFTPNGVMPGLLLLDNGVLVLCSGRPGIQIRFDFSGNGEVWSTPIDMIPYLKADGSIETNVSCGYVSFVDINKNTFGMVYSNFLTENKNGERRKSIWFRKIKVNK